jgi:hypothetical protein
MGPTRKNVVRIFKWTVLVVAILYIGAYLGIRAYSFKVPQLNENELVSIYLGSSESDVKSFFSMGNTELNDETNNDLDRSSQRKIPLQGIFAIMIWLDEKLTGAEIIDLNAA